MLPQPLPATGAPLSPGDQVRQAARARNTAVISSGRANPSADRVWAIPPRLPTPW